MSSGLCSGLDELLLFKITADLKEAAVQRSGNRIFLAFKMRWHSDETHETRIVPRTFPRSEWEFEPKQTWRNTVITRKRCSKTVKDSHKCDLFNRYDEYLHCIVTQIPNIYTAAQEIHYYTFVDILFSTRLWVCIWSLPFAPIPRTKTPRQGTKYRRALNTQWLKCSNIFASVYLKILRYLNNVYS